MSFPPSNLASLGPPIVNPPGVGFDGSDPNFTVPRLNGAGEWTRNTPGSNAQLMNYMNSAENSPLDVLNAVIKREDFPPGLEGQKQYEAALKQISSTPGPPDATGRSAQQRAVFEASQAAIRADQGGSSGLGVQSWAKNNQELALQALIAMTSGSISDPTMLTNMDDSVIRDLIIGLGGVNAVNTRMDEERNNLIELGVIQPSASSVGNPDATGNPVADILQGNAPVTEGSYQETLPEGASFPYNPQEGPFVPANDIPADASFPQNPQQGPPVLQDGSFQLEYNGQVIGTQGLPTMYQYSPVGQDVYLDVTDPNGYVRRYTGDVVEAAYTQMGYSDFDTMVAELGYDSAYQVLSSFAPVPEGAESGLNSYADPVIGEAYTPPSAASTADMGGGQQDYFNPTPDGGGGGGGSQGPSASDYYAQIPVVEPGGQNQGGPLGQDMVPGPNPLPGVLIWDVAAQQWVLDPAYTAPPQGGPNQPY